MLSVLTAIYDSLSKSGSNYQLLFNWIHSHQYTHSKNEKKKISSNCKSKYTNFKIPTIHVFIHNMNGMVYSLFSSTSCSHLTSTLTIANATLKS